jgi:Escherichia/Staphylococcus phage prohead protease
MKSPATELRVFEARSTAAPSGKPRITGYAATFNNPAVLPGFREIIRPGAFTRAIDEKQNCLCLWNHNPDLPLGSVASGTLQLDQDSRGLHYTCDLPDTQAGRDAYTLIKRGVVNQCSFGFMVDPEGQEWSNATDEKDSSQYVLRSIKDIAKLLDCSPVPYPAYQNTTVVARSVEAPVELRAAVNAHNRGFKFPTFEECLEITRRAAERKQIEARHRRQNLMSHIIN